MQNIGYRIYYYDSHRDKQGTVIHETQVDGDKVSYGKLEQSLSNIHTFEFELLYDHPLYGKINPINGLIKIINKFDNELEFYGRILKPDYEMDSQGMFSQRYVCESVLGYLQDSTQSYAKVSNTSVKEYLEIIINNHNSQVEPHKRFVLGNVTVKSTSDTPYRYIGYDTTFDTLKNFVLNRFGGYFVLRIENDVMYIDYLEKVGVEDHTPIQVGTNIESARRGLDLTNLITRIVPLGADLQNDEQLESSQYTTRRRVTIENVNNGKVYLEDPELVKKFGVIQRPVDWTEIEDSYVLLERAKQFLQTQKIALASWDIDVVELSLIDDNYNKFKLGNTHPIDNPPLVGLESLQIIKKVIDVNNPESIEIGVGEDNMTLSKFSLQQLEASKSMTKVLQDNKAKQKEITKQSDIAFNKSEIALTQSDLEKVTRRIAVLEEQKAQTKEQGVIDSMNIELIKLREEKQAKEEKLAELNKKLNELEAKPNDKQHQ